LATNGGEYTWSLTAAVTEKKMVPEGIYIIVPTTYQAGMLGMFELDIYSGFDTIDILPY
jgi:hypothetical protein